MKAELNTKTTGNGNCLQNISVLRYDFKPLNPHIAPVLTMLSLKPEALLSITRIGLKTKI